MASETKQTGSGIIQKEAVDNCAIWYIIRAVVDENSIDLLCECIVVDFVIGVKRRFECFVHDRHESLFDKLA